MAARPKNFKTLRFIRLKKDLLISWRLSKQVSQARAAELCGVAEATYRAAEGGFPVQALIAARMAQKLSMSLRELQVAER